MSLEGKEKVKKERNDDDDDGLLLLLGGGGGFVNMLTTSRIYSIAGFGNRKSSATK